MIRCMLAAACLLTLVPTLAAFDKVLLHDGRMIEGKILDEDRDGFLILELPGAEIPIATDLVKISFVEDLEDYVPKNSKEERYLERGYVLFEGQWMSKSRREQELKKRKEAEAEELAELRRRQDWRNAYVEETRHFIVTSNCAKEVMDEYVDRLENYYKEFTDAWAIKLSPGEVDGKMRVFLYRNYADFRRVTGSRPGVGGFFNWVEGELHLPHDDRDPEETMDTLYHEGNHLLTYLIDTSFRYPIWMNEGMAEYYGTAEQDEDGDFHVGGLQYKRIVSLRRDEDLGQFMGLRDVLMTEQGDFGARHYAVAWSFVHFLMTSDDYAKPFRGFFANLSENRDIEITEQAYKSDRGTLSVPDTASVVRALEKRLGRSIEELEEEWQVYREQTYDELDAAAYYRAAQFAHSNARRADSDEDYERYIDESIEHYDRATEMGIEDGRCWRDFSEMLRMERGDGKRAWEMVSRAIELDPINPYNYMEAAGVLLMDGPQQDLDRSFDMAETAIALAPQSSSVRGLYDELMAELEPARERRAEAERRAAELAASDRRIWTVLPFYFENEPEPDRIEGLSTLQLRELIQQGAVKGDDWIFQTFFETDEDGERIPTDDKWDREWVQLKDCPVFEEELASAEASGD